MENMQRKNKFSLLKDKFIVHEKHLLVGTKLFLLPTNTKINTKFLQLDLIELVYI